jgi:glutamate dehydrogenase (NADP+)
LVSESDTGFSTKDVLRIQALKVKHGYLVDAGLKGYRYVAGQRPWTYFSRLDIALPCATQNEVSGLDAVALVKAGVKYVAEGSNMVSDNATLGQAKLGVGLR